MQSNVRQHPKLKIRQSDSRYRKKDSVCECGIIYLMDCLTSSIQPIATLRLISALGVDSIKENLMATLLRWVILLVAFFFAALLFGVSKEIFPPSFLTGAIRGVLVLLFMSFVWRSTKKIGGHKNKDIEQ